MQLSCTAITGDLAIISTDLASLDLTALQSVGGSLTIAFNRQLTSVAGLAALKFVGSLSIVDNDEIADLNGLASLTSVGGSVYVKDNAILDDVQALCNSTVNGTIELHVGSLVLRNQNYCQYTTSFADSNDLKTAVDAWCDDRLASEAAFGAIAYWDVSAITSFYMLFDNCEPSQHADLSAWDVSSATNLMVSTSHTAWHIQKQHRRDASMVACRPRMPVCRNRSRMLRQNCTARQPNSRAPLNVCVSPCALVSVRRDHAVHVPRSGLIQFRLEHLGCVACDWHVGEHLTHCVAHSKAAQTRCFDGGLPSAHVRVLR